MSDGIWDNIKECGGFGYSIKAVEPTVGKIHTPSILAFARGLQDQLPEMPEADCKKFIYDICQAILDSEGENLQEWKSNIKDVIQERVMYEACWRKWNQSYTKIDYNNSDDVPEM